jgi:flagellar basal body-associated protein FliL
MDEAVANQGKGASKWGRGSWRPHVGAALLLPVAACAAWYLFRHSASSAHQEAKAQQEVRAVLHLEPFVANLADPEGDRFLRVGIDLGLDRDPAEDSRAGQNKLPMARTRDTILIVLTTCNADALLPAAGKAKLKEELIKALREHVPELGVQEVYFTEFLVQR